MQLPSLQQLNDERTAQRAKIKELKALYVAFLQQWEDLETQEHEMMYELHKHIDKAQLHDVLKKIDSIAT